MKDASSIHARQSRPADAGRGRRRGSTDALTPVSALKKSAASNPARSAARDVTWASVILPFFGHFTIHSLSEMGPGMAVPSGSSSPCRKVAMAAAPLAANASGAASGMSSLYRPREMCSPAR